MNWSEEFWIKLYRRASPSFWAMHWQARGLFRLVITELDPQGCLELGKLGLRAVAVVIQAPWVEVEPYLKECIEDGCLILSEDGAVLSCPNFVEAQETAQSDRARARTARARRQAKGKPVTSRHEPSRAVTENHVASRDVTAGHEPSQNVTEASQDVTPASRSVTSRHDESRGVTLRHDQIRREEIREEETSGSGARVSDGKRQDLPVSKMQPIPDDWALKPWHLSEGRSKNLTEQAVRDLAEQFRSDAQSKAKMSANWDAEFRKWIYSPIRDIEREALKRRQQTAAEPPKKPTKYFEPPPEMTSEQYAASARAAERARAQLGGASA